MGANGLRSICHMLRLFASGADAALKWMCPSPPLKPQLGTAKGAPWRRTIAPKTSSQMKTSRLSITALWPCFSTVLIIWRKQAPATALGPQPRTPDTVFLSQGFLPTLAFALPISASLCYKYRQVLPCQPRMFFPRLWSMSAFLTTHKQH